MYPDPVKKYILNTDATNEVPALAQIVDGNKRQVVYYSKMFSLLPRNNSVTKQSC